MLVRFHDADLATLEVDASFNGGYSEAIVKAFRRRMQQIRAAPDERTLYALKSLHFEKLKGRRSHQRSIRLNDQWRLILEFEHSGTPNVNRAVVVGIEDYH